MVPTVNAPTYARFLALAFFSVAVELRVDTTIHAPTFNEAAEPAASSSDRAGGTLHVDSAASLIRHAAHSLEKGLEKTREALLKAEAAEKAVVRNAQQMQRQLEEVKAEQARLQVES